MIGGLVLTTMRLHRAQVVVTAVLLAVLATTLTLDGRAVDSLVADYRLGCDPQACGELSRQIERHLSRLGQLLPFLGLIPAAIGAFWGAPAVGREYEAGTTKLAFTQSVSRLAWIVTRIMVLAALVAAGGAVFGLAVEDWLTGFEHVPIPSTAEALNGFGNIRGPAPVGWWLFGFAAGVIGGALLRRTVPAMVVSVSVVTAAVIVRAAWLAAAVQDGTSGIGAVDVLTETATTAALAVVMMVATCWLVVRDRA